MNIGINPLGARVVVQYQAVEESTSQGGVILPQTHQVNTYKADVVAVGEEVTKVGLGDLVLTSIGVGDQVEYQQEQYVIVDEADILAILGRA